MEDQEKLDDAASSKEEAALKAACLPPYEGEGLPPELRTVPRAELQAALRVVRAWVISQTGSKALADELVPDTYLKMTRTRRWNPARGPFARHFMLCVKSEKNHHFASKASEKAAMAHEGYAREELPSAAAGPEDLIVRAETESEEAAAGLAKASLELEQLRVRTAQHELMPQVIACIARGIEDAAAIAEELGVPVVNVYRARDLIRYHIRTIRQTEKKR